MSEAQVTDDPVIARLHRWAQENGLSRAAVASRLNVSRAAVAGWFLALEAREQKRPKPSSGRIFRFTDQATQVQEAIALVLNQPVHLLRAESLNGRGIDAGDATRAAAAIGLADMSSDRQDVASRLVDELVSSRTQRPKSTRHRVAETVDSVPGVATTVLVKDMRGSDRTEPYQYQLVVFAEPSEPTARHGDKSAGAPVADAAARLRQTITVALADAGLTTTWEHGTISPAIGLTGTDVSDWVRLGSLVIQTVAASRAPSRGLLIPPNRSRPSRPQLRHATLVTPPYGGSDPVGGFLANGLDVGHLRGADVARAFGDPRQYPDGIGTHGAARHRVELDAAFAVHHGLHLLQTGQVPGAWLMSVEAQLLVAYEPLVDVLVQLPTPVLLIRMSRRWQSMAAWRLAAAELNQRGRETSTGDLWSSDQITFMSRGVFRKPTRRELAVLEGQHQLAAQNLDDVRCWDDVLEQIAATRSGPTLTVVLDDLPDTGSAISFESGVYAAAFGEERFNSRVVFSDDVDAFVDAWTAASLELLDQLAVLAGYDDATGIADQLAAGPLARALERRQSVRPAG